MSPKPFFTLFLPAFKTGPSLVFWRILMRFFPLSVHPIPDSPSRYL